MQKRTRNKATSARSIRESALEGLASEYKDAALLYTELKRAIDSFSGELPPDSPIRYLRQTVGEALMSYMSVVKKNQSVPELVRELEDGGCIFGAIKSPPEIVRKAVNAYVQMGRLRWVDSKKTQVALAGSASQRKS